MIDGDRMTTEAAHVGVIYTTTDRIEILAWQNPGTEVEFSDAHAEIRIGRVLYRAPFAQTRAELTGVA